MNLKKTNGFTNNFHLQNHGFQNKNNNNRSRMLRCVCLWIQFSLKLKWTIWPGTIIKRLCHIISFQSEPLIGHYSVFAAEFWSISHKFLPIWKYSKKEIYYLRRICVSWKLFPIRYVSHRNRISSERNHFKLMIKMKFSLKIVLKYLKLQFQTVKNVFV